MSASTKLLLVMGLACTAGCLAATDFVVQYEPSQLNQVSKPAGMDCEKTVLLVRHTGHECTCIPDPTVFNSAASISA